jgi:hypothetical protein
MIRTVFPGGEMLQFATGQKFCRDTHSAALVLICAIGMAKFFQSFQETCCLKTF